MAYVINQPGSNVVDGSFAVNGALHVDTIISVARSRGTAIDANGVALTLDYPNVTANGYVEETAVGGSGAFTAATVEADENGVVQIKSKLGCAAGSSICVRGFLVIE